jgi:hypothetical protein
VVRWPFRWPRASRELVSCPWAGKGNGGEALTRTRLPLRNLAGALVLVLGGGLALAAAAPAAAITHDQASQRALAALGSSDSSGPVVVFALPRPLPARGRVRVEPAREAQLRPAEQRHDHDRRGGHRRAEAAELDVAAGEQALERLIEEVRDQEQERPATQRCAVRSLVAECTREPVKRQMIVIDASPSTNDDAAQTTSESELASSPATSPTTPSTLIHASEAHDS